MPRNRTVDYPQVHPPSTQTSHGLAPPQHHATSNRFSWQRASSDQQSLSQAAEHHLEAGDVDNLKELGQSKIPPLPVLPQDLGGSGTQEQEYEQPPTQAAYPVQTINTLPYQSQTQSLQYQYQQLQQQQLHQQYLRQQYLQQQYLQQQQQQTQPHQQAQYASPPVSYEASQAAHQPHPRLQEHAEYPDHHNSSQTQHSTNTLPVRNGHPEPQREEHQSSDVKHGEHETQPQKPVAVHIGPDVNPLSPTSPTHPIPTTNQKLIAMKSIPPPNQAPLEYPQPNTFSPSTGPTRGGTWHHTLGSCAEPATCLSSLFCPCIVYGRTQYRLGLKSAQKDPTNMLGYSAINGSCIAWSVLCGFNILLTAVQHRRVRKGYEMDEIAGSTGSDCIKSACCCCCILAQDEKEMRFREDKGGMGGSAMAEHGYQSPAGMTFSAPPRQ